MEQLSVARADSTHIVLTRQLTPSTSPSTNYVLASPPAAATPVVEPSSSQSPLISQPRKRGGGTAGRKNWQRTHLTELLNVVELRRPIGTDEWEVCAKLFNTATQSIGPAARVGKQLKEKFRQLCRMQGVTGDPHLPAIIERAQSIDAMIERHHAFGVSNNLNLTEDDNGIVNEEVDHDDAAAPTNDDVQPVDNPLPVVAAAAASSSISDHTGNTSFSPRPAKRTRRHYEQFVHEMITKQEANDRTMKEAIAAMANAMTILAQSTAAQNATTNTLLTQLLAERVSKSNQ